MRRFDGRDSKGDEGGHEGDWSVHNAVSVHAVHEPFDGVDSFCDVSAVGGVGRRVEVHVGGGEPLPGARSEATSWECINFVCARP